MTQRNSASEWLTEAIAQPTTACILWPFSATTKGYGRLSFKGKRVQATHLALILSGSPRPPAPNDYCLHTCPDGDNPACVNPRHLRWGTAAENNRESFARGRTNAGENHPMHRLTVEQVRDIRSRDYSQPGSYTAVGAEFGVRGTQVSRIVRRIRWADVT